MSAWTASSASTAACSGLEGAPGPAAAGGAWVQPARRLPKPLLALRSDPQGRISSQGVGARVRQQWVDSQRMVGSGPPNAVIPETLA